MLPMRIVIRPKILAGIGISVFLAACQKTEVAQAPEPPVQNAFTDYVDRSVTTTDKAAIARDKASAQTQKIGTHMQTATEPQ